MGSNVEPVAVVTIVKVTVSPSGSVPDKVKVNAEPSATDLLPGEGEIDGFRSVLFTVIVVTSEAVDPLAVAVYVMV